MSARESPRRRALVATAFAFFATVSVSALAVPEARAADAEVEATTTAQAYQLRGLTGDPILSRRRVTQTLGLGVYNIAGDSTPGGPQLFFRVRMRLDTDFGESREEYSLAGGPDPTRFVPGLQPAPVDVMYGYLEGKRYAGGMLGFRVGRQYVIDSLGYYAFDGGQLRITTPAFVAVEVYGGFETRAGLPLSSGRWELGGVQRGSRTDYPPGAYPSFQKAGLAPMFAAAIESQGPTWIHGRLTYRKAFNTGQSFVGGGGALLGPNAIGVYDARRVSSERLGYSVNAELGEVAALRGVLTYDLYGRNWNEIQAGGDLFLSQKVTAGVDYEYWRPIFDADSIFNVFGLEPMDDVSARLEIDPTDRVQLEGDAMVRRYKSDDPNDLNRVATSLAPGGGLRVRYKWPTARGTARGQMITGDQGTRVGYDLVYDRIIHERWSIDGRLSLWHFEDKLRNDGNGRSRSATSFGYVVGGGYKLTPEATAMLQFEHDMNRLVGQRFRVLAVLNIRTWL